MRKVSIVSVALIASVQLGAGPSEAVAQDQRLEAAKRTVVAEYAARLRRRAEDPELRAHFLARSRMHFLGVETDAQVAEQAREAESRRPEVADEFRRRSDLAERVAAGATRRYVERGTELLRSAAAEFAAGRRGRDFSRRAEVLAAFEADAASGAVFRFLDERPELHISWGNRAGTRDGSGRWIAGDRFGQARFDQAAERWIHPQGWIEEPAFCACNPGHQAMSYSEMQALAAQRLEEASIADSGEFEVLLPGEGASPAPAGVAPDAEATIRFPAGGSGGGLFGFGD